MIIQTGSDIRPGNNSNTFYTCKLCPKGTSCMSYILLMLMYLGNETADAVIRSTLALHKNIAEVDSEDIIHLLEIQHPTRGSQDELMQAAAQHLILTLYKNQLMHIFVRVAMVTLSINSCTEETLAMSK